MANITTLGNMGSQVARNMTTHSQQLLDKSLVQSPERLAQYNAESFNFSTQYQLIARSMQDLHRDNQLLGELLRDA